MKKTLTGMMLVGASLLLINQTANAQSWNLAGNANATNASRLGATVAGVNLSVFAGNVERMRILGASGNVGIGTIAPATRLHVVGTTRLQGATGIIGTTTITGNASVSGTTSLTGDLFVPANIRNNNTAGAQIVKISTTAGSDCGIQFNRPGVGFFDFRMVNIGGNLRWQGSTDEFATINNEFMNLNLSNGNLGIGASPGTAKLSVCGTVRCTELRVETGWCDYVFAKDYKLRPLEEVEAFIEENHHLPDIDPGVSIETDGLNVGEMSAKMIKKIEELTLYVIQQNNRIKALEKENALLINTK
jgi:hypothetical protein